MKKLFSYSLSTFIIFFIIHNINAQSVSESNLKNDLEHIGTIENPKEKVKLLKPYLQKDINGLDKKLLSQFYYELGVTYGMLYKVDSSKQYFQNAIKYSTEASDTLALIGAYNGLGNISRMENRNDDAKFYFEKALTLAEDKQSDEFFKWRANLLGNLGGIFFDLKDYETALEYSLNALSNVERIADSFNIAMNLIRIGYSHNSMNNNQLAYEANLRATHILEKIDNKQMLIFQYYNLGEVLMNRKALDSASFYFNKCLKLSDEFQEWETHTGSLTNLGNVALQRNNYDQAMQYANRAVSKAESHDLITHLERAYKLLYQIALAQKQFETAIEYLNMHYATRDSIQKEETIKSVEEFKVKYETAKKEKEIEALNYENKITKAEAARERTIKIALAIVAVILVVFFMIIYFTQRQKSRLREAALSGEISDLRLEIRELLGKYEGQFDVDLDTLNNQLVNPLSSREFDVLQQIFFNKSNKEIADDLYVSINTVKTHLKNIYSKLGVTNRNEVLKSLINNK